jgi:hypothetical protein
MLSSGDKISLTSTQLPAEDIPGVKLTRDTLSSGTVRAQKNGPPGKEGAVGENVDGESFLPGQQSTFDKSMPGAPSEEGVCRDQMIEPVLYSNNVGRVSHIRDPAPMDWSDQDRRKYHQVELQALLGGPIPADTQLVIRAFGQRSFDGWLGVVIRQMSGLCLDQDFIVWSLRGSAYMAKPRIPPFWTWELVALRAWNCRGCG